MKRYLIGGFLFGAAFAVFMLVFLVVKYDRNKTSDENQITNFEECVAAGYQATQTHPRHCFVPDGPNLPGGRDFIEQLNNSELQKNEGLESVTIIQEIFGLEKAQTKIVTSNPEWEKLWSQLKPNDTKPPSIDFTDYAVIAVFVGQNDSVYSVAIEKVVRKDGGFKAVVKQNIPGDGCDVPPTAQQPAPFHIIALKLPYPEDVDKTLYRPGWSIDTFEFEIKKEINDC
jgi:hypothetical protein